MPAEVIRLRTYRAKLEGTPTQPSRVPLAIQAAPQAVGLVLPDHEIWLTPEQAYDIALDLFNAAREAKGA